MLSNGVYKLSDAARYIGISPNTLTAWFKPRSDGQGLGPLFTSDYGSIDGDFAISFINLIEAYVARFFRDEGVKPGTIRRAYDILALDLKTPHPFAHAELRTDGASVIRRTADEVGNTLLTDVVKRQHIFRELEDGLGRIEYGDNRLARRWHIRRGSGIVIDPALAFGKPIIAVSGMPTYFLARQFAANNGDANLVADLFDVTAEQVAAAVKFESALSTRAA